MELGRDKPPADGRVMKKETVVAGVAVACLILLGAAGGGLIAWWAVSFHRDNNQLWMVPVGLVLLCTPAVAWISVFASDACRRPEILLTANPLRDPEPGDQRNSSHTLS